MRCCWWSCSPRSPSPLCSARDNARPLLGQFYAPLAGVAIAQAVVFAVYFPLRAAFPSSTVVSVVSWIFVLSIPAIGLVCGAGRLDRRVQTATALERMARRLGDERQRRRRASRAGRCAQGPVAAESCTRFPATLAPGSTSRARPSQPADAEPAQRVTHVSSDNWRIAIVHDASLADSRELVHTTGSYALARLEMSRLTDELRDSLHDLAESRASRLTAEQDDASEDRARPARRGATASGRAAREAGIGGERARGPRSGGCRDAPRAGTRCRRDDRRGPGAGARHLSTAAGAHRAQRCSAVGQSRRWTADDGARRRARPLWGQHRDDGLFRLLRGVAERRQTRHVATGVTISVWEDERLHFEVRDDGVGFDLPTTPYGTGLSNLSDRLAAVGGTITIQSAPGQGTVLAGTIPFA